MFVYIFAVALAYLAMICVGITIVISAITWMMGLITEKIEKIRK